MTTPNEARHWYAAGATQTTDLGEGLAYLQASALATQTRQREGRLVPTPPAAAPPPPTLRPVNALVTAAGAALAGLALIGLLILATAVIL